MHIIIVGGGKIGVSLAERLAVHKHDVVMIDNDKKKCQEIADEFNGIVINGDANEINVLEEAKIRNADALVAVTSNEEINLFSCLIAKEVSKVKTFARIVNPKYEKLFKKVGIDVVLSPEVALATRLENMIIEPDIVDIAMVHRGSVEMIEYVVHRKSKAIGKKIKMLEKPRGAGIIAIKEDGKYIIPEEHTQLKEGDNVIIIIKKELEESFRKMFA